MHLKIRLSSAQVIIAGFLSVILLGTLLLMLPFASSDNQPAPFLESLFTTTSAVCVTGLVVRDTATAWSLFGQIVIILLIQIGGLGVVTVTSLIAMLSGRKIGIVQRSTLQDAISAPNVGGILKLTSFILKFTLIFELGGAVLLAPAFIGRFGVGRGIWYSVFHSISAFCNAGFDLMGVESPFSSLTSWSGDILVNSVLILLIVCGGLGFLTWGDIRTHRFHFRKYRMQSKVIIITTAILLIVPAVYFFFAEFAGYPIQERILLSLFQAVTPRTAGFNTADFTLFRESTVFLMIILMLIGGSPGSTAGGMKTTTVAVLFASVHAAFRRRSEVHLFKRSLEEKAIRSAAALFFLYFFLFTGSAMIISMIENLPLLACMFETASAVGTAGLTLGLTTSLHTVSRILLVLLMFIGRVGGLTLIFASLSQSSTRSSAPQDKITVG